MALGSVEKDVGSQSLHAVSCASVDWNSYSSIGFARQCGYTLLWLNPTATQWKRFNMLTYSWVHDPKIAGQPYSFCHGWSGTIVYLQTEAAKLWNHSSQPFCRVVDLRERLLEYWTPYSETHHPREHNSKRSSYHQWCAFPTRRVTYSPHILSKYMFINLPCDVIRSTARFRLRVHTLRFEKATWNK